MLIELKVAKKEKKKEKLIPMIELYEMIFLKHNLPEYVPRLSLYLLLSLATPKKSYSA